MEPTVESSSPHEAAPADLAVNQEDPDGASYADPDVAHVDQEEQGPQAATLRGQGLDV